MSAPDELSAAHEEIDTIMAANEYTRLQKAMNSLNKFKAAAGKATGNATDDEDGMKEEENAEASRGISRARGRSKPGETGDQYKGVPADGGARDDSRDYEGDDEEDMEDGEDIKPLRRSLRAAPGATDVYDQLIKSDRSGGDAVRTIDATDALSVITETFAKSLAKLGSAIVGNEQEIDRRVERLEKSLATVAAGLGQLIEFMAGQATAQPAPAAPAGDPLAKAMATMATVANAAPSIEEQMVQRMNAGSSPTYFQPGLGAPQPLAKSVGGPAAPVGPEVFNTLEGRQTVVGALRKGMDMGLVPASLLADIDFELPSNIIARVPAHVRAQIGL